MGADEQASSPFAPPKADGSGPLDRSKVNFGVKSASKPRGAFDYVTKHLAGTSGGNNGGGGGAGPSGSSSPSPAPPHSAHAYGSPHGHHHHHHGHSHSGERHSGGSDRGMPPPRGSGSQGSGYGGGGYGQRGASAQHDDDDERYSDDFEDDDEVENAAVAQQRNRIIKNVQDMASFDDESKGSIANVKENVRVRNALSDKARALRERCEAALGPKFTPVYDFLRKVRLAQAGMNVNEKNEKEIQKRLLDIVVDKAKMPGCFLVDQLVFSESMYTN